jgi:thiol-disulfide isomerase/thioredoxin
MKRLPSQAVLQALGGILVLALAGQLVQTKRLNADLRTQIARETQPFVFGTPLPQVSLSSAESEPLMLSRVCAEGKMPVLVFFWSNTCKACKALAPLLSEVGRNRRDMRIVLVGADGVQPREDVNIGPGIRAIADPREVSGRLNVQRIPTLIASDSACRVAAASTGRIASESLLKMLLSHGPT